VPGGGRFVPVMFDVKLGCFRRMMGCVMHVALGSVRVVSRCLMVSRIVMVRRLMMMSGGVFVMLCCLAMMFACFLRHGVFSSSSKVLGPAKIAPPWLASHEKSVNVRSLAAGTDK
jgi:hypothetical protein